MQPLQLLGRLHKQKSRIKNDPALSNYKMLVVGQNSGLGNAPAIDRVLVEPLMVTAPAVASENMGHDLQGKYSTEPMYRIDPGKFPQIE